MIIIAVVFALAAGACFAVGGVRQQREASRRPESESLSPRLLWNLARQPAWLAGMGATAGAFLFKSVALAFGPLAVVQPLIASELVFAIPASVRREGLRLGLREWAGIGAITAGLTVGIVAAQPNPNEVLPSLAAWGAALSALTVFAVVALLVGRRIEGAARTPLYALAAVAGLAAQSALLTATVTLFRMGPLTALTSWEPYATGLVSILALTLVQSAYQAGPLAKSMPVMDSANPVVGIVVGLALFHETIATDGWHLPAALLGVGLLIAGVLVIDTSPLVLRVGRSERVERAADPMSARPGRREDGLRSPDHRADPGSPS